MIYPLELPTMPDGLTCSIGEKLKEVLTKRNLKAKLKRVSKDGRIPKKFGKLQR